ncbi:MAG TPA: AI-2E family transporter [Propionibacteriaceae bacterium]|nr:AI-2E family transporter [Propionibacteriaceae bacterium]
MVVEPERPSPEPPAAPGSPRPETHPLLRRSPFTIGFLATVGALTAWVLVRSLGEARGILILVAMALFLALGLNPAVEWLVRRRLRRALAVAVVGVLALGLLSFFAWANAPIVSRQVNQLIADTPRYLANLTRNDQIASLDENFNIIDRITAFLASGTLLQTLFGGLWGAGKLLANVVFSIILVVILTLYFLASLPAIKDVIYRLAPASKRQRTRTLADQLFSGIGSYLMGMGAVVGCAAVTTWLYLKIVGLDEYAVALAAVVGALYFLPVVGAPLAGILVSIVGYSVSPTLGTATLIFFVLYMIANGWLIRPVVMRHAIRVPGAVAIVAALIGWTLLGVIGVLLAIPTAALLLVGYHEMLLPHLDQE